jgi:fibronectin-binding autotransporter adhesin
MFILQVLTPHIGDAGTDILNVNATSDFNANVNIDGILTQTANATFTGALVNITSANTTVGDAGTDKLNVNATSDFNANVNIDGLLTQTANATFTGALVNITGANTTIGDAGTDVLNVNATADFNAGVNIDGLLTQTANATFSGAETYFNNNVTLGATTADTVSILGYVDANVLPSATTVDLGSDAKPFGNVHTTYVWSDNNIDTQGDFIVRGSTTRTLKALSTNTGYQTFNLVLETSTSNQKLPLVANSTGIHGGANTTYDLGSTAINWNKLYVKDAAVANSAVVSNVLTVNSQANTASLMVRDLTATRVPFVGTGGEIVDSANLVFSGTTLAVTGAATVSTDLSVSGNATVTGTATINTQANTASLMVRDLTVNRVPFVSTGGEIVDSANLTFTSSTLAVTGNTTISANLSVTNVISAANVVSSTHVSANTLGTSGLATLNSMNVVNTATFNANVDLQDSDYLLIGTSDDLQLFHDGIHSYIKDTGTGDLIVDASIFRVMNAANTENMIVATQDSGVILYANSVARPLQQH